ncbi:hypothetical protein TNCV_3187171 [Trichonephila clavipes]|nr:hypothetical protein TNCV_3187171 [Trichonephila clavipes]
MLALSLLSSTLSSLSPVRIVHSGPFIKGTFCNSLKTIPICLLKVPEFLMGSHGFSINLNITEDRKVVTANAAKDVPITMGMELRANKCDVQGLRSTVAERRVSW